jgi:hypothetical protein
MTHVRTANKCFLCVQTMSGLSPGVKCQVTVFFSNRFLCHKTRCDLLLYKFSRPYHSGLGKVEPWHRTLRSSSQNISRRVSSRCRASSKSFVTSTKFDCIAVVTVAPARRLRACRPDATGHIDQPHERVRNGVVDVRGYVTRNPLASFDVYASAGTTTDNQSVSTSLTSSPTTVNSSARSCTTQIGTLRQFSETARHKNPRFEGPGYRNSLL